MNEFLGRITFVAAIAAGGVPWGMAVAGPTDTAIKASIDTEETLRPNPLTCPNQPYLVGSTMGKGTASHLGQVTLIATDCVTPSPTSFSFTNGKLTLVAANGDVLSATYAGILLPTTVNSTIFSISGNFTVLGGNGRFSGASGSGYIEGTEDVATGKGHFDITGTLSY